MGDAVSLRVAKAPAGAPGACPCGCPSHMGMWLSTCDLWLPKADTLRPLPLPSHSCEAAPQAAHVATTPLEPAPPAGSSRLDESTQLKPAPPGGFARQSVVDAAYVPHAHSGAGAPQPSPGVVQEAEQLRPAATSRTVTGGTLAASKAQGGPDADATAESSTAAAAVRVLKEEEEEQAAYWTKAKLGEPCTLTLLLSRAMTMGGVSRQRREPARVAPVFSSQQK
jgi:hypothetical protein